MTAQKPEKPRRGGPPKSDPAHILKVAREVFLARGIRATTQEVAERAGVSEGSIFYRFKSKEGLFREAMEVSEDDMPSLVLVALSSMNSESIEESLQTLGQALIDIARVGLPLMMMSWSNPTVGSACDEPNALKFREIVTRLSSYFEAQMDAGRLRRMDSEIIARSFLGAIHHYCMSRMFAEEYGLHVIPEGMFIRGHVDLLLRGTEPRADVPSSPYSRRLDSLA